MNTQDARSSSPSRPFGYLAWAGAAGLILTLGITMAALAVRKLDELYLENGPLENMAMALWLLSAFAAAAAYRRWTGHIDRIMAFWIALIACLAALREADAQILLNPAVIGRFGIHYRIDWLLDPNTSILLKLAYAGLAILIAFAVLSPLYWLRSRFWRLTLSGDAGIGMLIVAVAGIAIGYSMDDLLRGTPMMTKAVRQLVEESGEFLGAIAFLAGSLLLWKSPISERIRFNEK